MRVQGRDVPAHLAGELVAHSGPLTTISLAANLDEHGYVLLRGALPGHKVRAAMAEVFGRLSEVGDRRPARKHTRQAMCCLTCIPIVALLGGHVGVRWARLRRLPSTGSGPAPAAGRSSTQTSVCSGRMCARDPSCAPSHTETRCTRSYLQFGEHNSHLVCPLSDLRLCICEVQIAVIDA